MAPGIEALVFDFDGLLMHTETTHLDSWRTEWAYHGLALDESTFFADHGGDTSEQHYAALAAAVGSGFDRPASHARRIAYRDTLHEGLDLAPGVRDWFAAAAGLGLRLAVASSSPRAWVEDHLTRVGELGRFEARAFGDEVAGHKPDPAVYLLALRRLDLPPGRVVAFEDTAHGVAAAKAAGLRCVAIPNPYTDPTAFSAADVVLRAATDLPLPELLARL
ncbi:HAD-IA family hydrolase [Dactylosporangium salmoneum]